MLHIFDFVQNFTLRYHLYLFLVIFFETRIWRFLGQILSEYSVSYFEGFAFINIDVFFREMRRNHEIGAFYPGIFRLLEDITTLKDVSQISLATKHFKFKSLLGRDLVSVGAEGAASGYSCTFRLLTRLILHPQILK